MTRNFGIRSQSLDPARTSLAASMAAASTHLPPGAAPRLRRRKSGLSAAGLALAAPIGLSIGLPIFGEDAGPVVIVLGTALFWVLCAIWGNRGR